MLDLERFDFCEVMMGRRMIEELRERDTQMNQALPVEIAEDDTLPRFVLCCLDQSHLFAKIPPDLAVVDDTIDPGPEVRIYRGAELFLPPEVERKVGIELRKNNVRQESALFAFEQEGELFGTDLFSSRPG